MSHHVVVAGAGYAGLLAAKRLDRRLRHTDATVTLLNADDRFVERVRLHQLAAGHRLRELPLAELIAGTRIRLVVARITALEPSLRAVRIDRPPHAVGYDTLVYALGSRSAVDKVPGAVEHACPVAESGQALRLRDRLAAIPSGGSVAVVGGGLTGLEAATELAEAYPSLNVRLLAGSEVGAGLAPRARQHLRSALDRLRITVHQHTRVAEVHPDAVRTEGGTAFAADATVWTTGFRAAALAEQAGLATDGLGRMTVDATLRSLSHPEVYAVGDAAAGQAVGGSVARMSCQAALPMGRQVADVIAARLEGRKPSPVRIGYAFTNISLGRRNGIVQLTRRDDSPRGSVFTGYPAAAFKEAVVRSTILAARHPGPLIPSRR
ncbi:NAD(P)/FAD-dependent oxidoreductase [Streptomyces sp. TP-A0874]|uniref:NAD(P)/FAD-dependent oxidoreductase n=1 Tax=Streptomyces sp. TP-A0874 TaxID=549819 RepID=UPI000852DF34|nr:FAD-dependent oxidoreductase [Streptomyces sp. TP-A0874]